MCNIIKVYIHEKVMSMTLEESGIDHNCLWFIQLLENSIHYFENIHKIMIRKICKNNWHTIIIMFDWDSAILTHTIKQSTQRHTTYRSLLGIHRVVYYHVDILGSDIVRTEDNVDTLRGYM